MHPGVYRAISPELPLANTVECRAEGAAAYELWTNIPVACSPNRLMEAAAAYECRSRPTRARHLPSAETPLAQVEGEDTEWHSVVLVFQKNDEERGVHVTSRIFVPTQPGRFELTARVVRVDGSIEWLGDFGRNLQVHVAEPQSESSVDVAMGVGTGFSLHYLMSLHPVALHVVNEVLYALLTEDAGFVGGDDTLAVEAGLELWKTLAGDGNASDSADSRDDSDDALLRHPVSSAALSAASIVAIAASIRVHVLQSRTPFWENPTLLNDAVCIASVLVRIPLAHVPRWQAKVLEVLTECGSPHSVHAVKTRLSQVTVMLMPSIATGSSSQRAGHAMPALMAEGAAAGQSRRRRFEDGRVSAFGTGMGIRSSVAGSSDSGGSGGLLGDRRELDVITEDGKSSVSSLATDETGSTHGGSKHGGKDADTTESLADSEQKDSSAADVADLFASHRDTASASAQQGLLSSLQEHEAEEAAHSAAVPTKVRSLHRPKRLKLARSARDKLRTPGERALLLLARWASEGCHAAHRRVLSIAEEAFSACVQCSPSVDCSADLVLYTLQRLLVEGHGSSPRKVYFIRVLQEFLAKPHMEQRKIRAAQAAAQASAPGTAHGGFGSRRHERMVSTLQGRSRGRTPIAKLVVVAVQDVILSYVAAASAESTARQFASSSMGGEEGMVRDAGRGAATISDAAVTASGAAVQHAGVIGSGETRRSAGPASGPGLTPSLIPVMQFMAQALGRSSMLTDSALRDTAVVPAANTETKLSCNGCDACALNPSAFTAPKESTEPVKAETVKTHLHVPGHPTMSVSGVVVDPSTIPFVEPAAAGNTGYDSHSAATQQAAEAVRLAAGNASADRAHAQQQPASLSGLGKTGGGMTALKELSLCPRWNQRPGGQPSVTMWLEASKAVAIAAVKLSALDSTSAGGVREDTEYEHVLEVALILSKACPLLRSTMLKRILRKWPKGYADNEVALLRFLARILSDAHALQDLVITRLSADIVGRVVACMQSPHVKVLKAAFALAAPSSRHFYEFVKHQPKLLAKIIAGVQDNKETHWSPAVRSASEDFEAWYWDKVEPQLMDSVKASVAQQADQSRRVHRLGSLMAQVDGASMRGRPAMGQFPLGGRSASPPLQRGTHGPFPTPPVAAAKSVPADADSAQCAELEADVKLWRQSSPASPSPDTGSGSSATAPAQKQESKAPARHTTSGRKHRPHIAIG